jgi:hypothetical protein
VPRAGDRVDDEPAELLDRLLSYRPDDALAEAVRWLDAKGDRWEEALREVGWSAAVKGDDGPGRRSVLPAVLIAAGPRVASLLDGWRGDPWLSAPSAVAREVLDLGPEPTLGQRLWLAVDALCSDLDDPDDFEESLADVPLIALLTEPGGVRAALALDHPLTREVLRLAAAHLDDPVLVRQLRKAVSRTKSAGPSKGLLSARGRSRESSRRRR